MTDQTKVFSFIERCDNADELNKLIANAKKQNEQDVERAAFRRLIYISPVDAPGSLEHDFWSTVIAFEHLLKQERGKTVLLARTRQKLKRVGVVQTLTDWATDTKETDGFQMLIERGMPDLTGEAIVLRHPHRFSSDVIHSARARLVQHCSDERILWPLGQG